MKKPPTVFAGSHRSDPVSTVDPSGLVCGNAGGRNLNNNGIIRPVIKRHIRHLRRGSSEADNPRQVRTRSECATSNGGKTCGQINLSKARASTEGVFSDGFKTCGQVNMPKNRVALAAIKGVPSDGGNPSWQNNGNDEPMCCYAAEFKRDIVAPGKVKRDKLIRLVYHQKQRPPFVGINLHGQFHRIVRVGSVLFVKILLYSLNVCQLSRIRIATGSVIASGKETPHYRKYQRRPFFHVTSCLYGIIPPVRRVVNQKRRAG